MSYPVMPHDDSFSLAEQAAEVIYDASGVAEHQLALTLGSGWGLTLDALGETVATLPANEVPGFHASGVPGHRGEIRSIRMPDGRFVLALAARTHLYQGLGVAAVAHGARVAAACGAHTMVLTNGVGGIDPTWAPGTPVLVSDHINMTGESPLEAANFLDMTNLYDDELRARAQQAVAGLPGWAPLLEGVLMQLRGPQYETPAEIAMARTLGANMVGMSIVLEAIAAREVGMKVLGLSLVTNHAAGISNVALSHADVVAAGEAAAPRLSELLAAVLPALP